MRSKITNEQSAAEVSKVTNVASSGRMSMSTKDFFGLTRVQEVLQYARESNFFERVLEYQRLRDERRRTSEPEA